MPPSPRARKQKNAGRRRPPVTHDHAEQEVDGCSFEFEESEATPDAALPPCRGGVEEKRRRRG
jgi:hypothetical protein